TPPLAVARRRSPVRPAVEPLEDRTAPSATTAVPPHPRGAIHFEVAAVVYPNHFTQPGGQASAEATQQFVADAQGVLDGTLHQLPAASNGILQGTFRLTVSTRVLTAADYDQAQYGSNQWLVLKGSTIDAMRAQDFGGATPAVAFVMWGPNQTIGTANFYHGNRFISLAGGREGGPAPHHAHPLRR